MAKIKIAVLFGGRSTEHEVSIITGVQVANAVNKDNYEVIPIYITKEGKWIKGDQSYLDVATFKNLQKAIEGKSIILPSVEPQTKGAFQIQSNLLGKNLRALSIDVVFPAFHGRYGEDGAIQGLLELSGIAYVGCDVESSSIGMDKVIAKIVAESIGIPTLDDVWFSKKQWQKNKKECLEKVNEKLGFDVFVKPAHLGSSIGIGKVKNIKELENALDVAFFYDTKVMVEKSLEEAKEVNISILGNDPYEFSATEQPLSTGDILSFEDKYISKKGQSKGMASAKRVIPAPISNILEKEIKNYSERFFKEIGGEGIARIDYLLKGDKVYFNEINTMPGSLAFYLWKEIGVSFDKLVDKLVNLAFKRSETQHSLTTTFSSNILKRADSKTGSKT